MAMIKALELKNGAIGEYIRIDELHHRNGSTQATVRLQLWKCHDTRIKLGAEPLSEQVYSLNLEPSDSADLVQRCYEALKLLSDFTGAIDA